MIDRLLQPYSDYLKENPDVAMNLLNGYRYRRYLAFIARDTRDPNTRFVACTALSSTQEDQRALEEYFIDLARRTHPSRYTNGSTSGSDARSEADPANP